MTRWIGIIIAFILIASCFMPWVTIESKQITITGFDTKGTNFGQPALVHIILASSYIILLLINRLWSLITSFFLSAIIMAWSIRNFLIISACFAGECPAKHFGLYLMLFSACATIFFFIVLLFIQRQKLKKKYNL